MKTTFDLDAYLNSFVTENPIGVLKYTTLAEVVKNLKDKNNNIYKVDSFNFKGFECWWDGNPEMNRLRCDPNTDKQYNDFYRLQKEVEYKTGIVVDLS